MKKKRMIVGISGASCAALGVMLLQEMQRLSDWETHLVITRGGRLTIVHETPFTPEQVEQMATVSYPQDAVGAAIASGSFDAEGMVVVPCSMKTLAGIAVGYSDTLLLRAADVTLKERRKLVLVARESPLSKLHLQNMLHVTDLGGIILPPMVAMYSMPQNIDGLLRQIVGRIVRIFGTEIPGFYRWGEEEDGIY